MFLSPYTLVASTTETNIEDKKREDAKWNECAEKKSDICFSPERKQSEKDRLRALQKEVFDFEIYEDDGISELESFVYETESTEECLFLDHRLPKEFSEENMSYFGRYLDSIKLELQEVRDIQDYINRDLFVQEYNFDKNKQKVTFEKLERDLEKTESKFRDIVGRDSVKNFSENFKSFIQKALKGGKITCDSKKLMKVESPTTKFQTIHL